ncbi:hypothetical protein DCAR_0205336 [Daucus carota subsp. sativus]|uniref:4-coumarate--CoA ligase n=1 Tax=Daucus carota subsp. sativus TaxID=79200 RepID=A0AAF0WA34_DAUCS|nr:hypothetical protein DCAR_0205336 [Daucus carota subsp. sativus]
MSIYSQAHICQCLTRISTLRHNATVTITETRRKTGEKFVADVLSLAGGLVEVVGLKPGDVVAISALNSDLYLEWLLAVTYVGGICAPFNYRWSLAEAKSAMEVVRPILLVTDVNSGYWHSKFRVDTISSISWHVLMEHPVELDITANGILTTEMLKKLCVKSQSLNYVWGPDGAAIICFTSGTTGRPKGVTLSHSAFTVQSLAKIAAVGYGENDVYLHTAPLCHIGGLSSALAMLMVGGCHVLIPKFEARLALEAIDQHGVTSLITVPAMLSDMVSVIRTKEAKDSLQSIKKILNGGGSLSAELLKDAIQIFPRSKIVSAYGMTEACSSLTFMTLYDSAKENCDQSLMKGETRPEFHEPRGVCVGKTAPHVELKINSEDVSHAGLILIRGPHMMLGYWGQIPTEKPVPGNGDWFDTGDIGRLDNDGNVWLIGRTNDRIKSGGENVYPEEVEAVVSKHPGVAGAVVVGLPDSRFTEIVVACIQPKPTWTWSDYSSKLSAKDDDRCLTSQILQNFCKENNLTGFKVPKYCILWKKPFPLTTTGKLRREQVRSEVISHTQIFPCRL